MVHPLRERHVADIFWGGLTGTEEEVPVTVNMAITGTVVGHGAPEGVNFLPFSFPLFSTRSVAELTTKSR
jgi:hypothetical protein